MTNSEKIGNLITTCLRNNIPLDKASLSIDNWSDVPNLSFEAKSLSREELRNLKRICDFKIEGKEEAGSKSLVGETKEGPRLSVRVNAALTCTKVTYDQLSAADLDRVIQDFKAGKAFIMDCEQTGALEEASLVEEVSF